MQGCGTEAAPRRGGDEPETHESRHPASRVWRVIARRRSEMRGLDVAGDVSDS